MYDIIVVGGGHAGCEASYACAKKGYKTLLMTSNIKNIADMPCNPHIGGSAKGIVVREIDALGGIMGKVADKTHLQIKMLNSAKGPAVQSLRAQGDKITYPKEMLETLNSLPTLEIKEGMVEDLIVENSQVKGIVLEDGTKIDSKITILTTGTYLKADILVGNTRTRKGPHDERPSNFLSDKLKEYGFKVIRLKTGTPQRIDKKSIDFSKTKEEPGDSECYSFNTEETNPLLDSYMLKVKNIDDIKTTVNIIKNTDKDSYKKVTNAKKQCEEIQKLIPKVESKETKQNLIEIYDTVNKIINTVEKKPQKINKLDNFFDYYLPVLIKIVNRYDEVENQNLKSEDGKAFLKKADKMIRDTNMAFQTLLSSLYQKDIIDVDADIEVYNLMLKADGIVDDNHIMKGRENSEK